MHDREFNALMSPIERSGGASWLLKITQGNGAELIQVVEVGEDGKASYREAKSSDISEGAYFKDNR
ncbi:hypothetical protein [Bradyrhizobium sp. RDM4]|uniref:hypothetical protein n=1 Tax=Bradyrhizobium sp. RDM4 TaxID=3378765 RepID=UPI0038FBECEB